LWLRASGSLQESYLRLLLEEGHYSAAAKHMRQLLEIEQQQPRQLERQQQLAQPPLPRAPAQQQQLAPPHPVLPAAAAFEAAGPAVLVEAHQQRDAMAVAAAAGVAAVAAEPLQEVSLDEQTLASVLCRGLEGLASLTDALAQLDEVETSRALGAIAAAQAPHLPHLPHLVAKAAGPSKQLPIEQWRQAEQQAEGVRRGLEGLAILADALALQHEEETTAAVIAMAAAVAAPRLPHLAAEAPRPSKQPPIDPQR
jgi:hypothetical protein